MTRWATKMIYMLADMVFGAWMCYCWVTGSSKWAIAVLVVAYVLLSAYAYKSRRQR